MRIRKKSEFRPLVETVEPRIVATAGIAAVAHSTTHLETHSSKTVSTESHQQPHHPVTTASTHHAQTSKANHIQQTSIAPRSSTTTTTNPSSPPSWMPTNTTNNQAWVELVNMTGKSLDYQIKLGPYSDGQFLDYEIGAGSSQFRMSSLISNGQRVLPDFAIQFGNGQVTPLVSGNSQQTAQGYYIFQGTDAQYFVEPFFTMPGPF